MIKNLAQLKKAIENGKRYAVLEHYIHPQFEGQTRVPFVTQTNGYYSISPENPDLANLNNGKGCWNDYGKASDWEFHEDGTITQYHTWTPYNADPVRDKVQKIKFIDE